MRTRLYYHVDNLCLPRYDHVMTVSPLLSEHCLALGVHAKRLTYLPNGIESQQFVRQRSVAEAKASLGMPGDQLVLGCVGRLSPEKGVDRAIDTLAAVRQRGVDVALHLIGDGPERDALARQATALNLADHIVFHGWQRDARRLYEAMDALLLPSHTEGLPNVVLEAMAMGVPVAATRVGAVPDVLDEGNCGVILDKEDVSDWPTAVEAMLRHDVDTQSIIHAARARVEQQFDFQSRVTAELDVYDRVLDRPAFATVTAPLQPATVRRAA
jgi:glycosyltransferase involved in cell wall biosynthesis